MAIHRAIALLIILGLTACGSPMRSSVIPASANPEPNSPTTLAVRYGTTTLLLAADRQNLPTGAIARIMGFGANVNTPLFKFFVSVPNPPAVPVKIQGITSDTHGRIYLSFTTFPSSASYRTGAVAIYNTIPSTGSTRNPDELMTPVGAAITPPPFAPSGQGLAVDNSGRIFAADEDLNGECPTSQINVYPALSNGPTTPIVRGVPNCGGIDRTSIAIAPTQEVYQGGAEVTFVWNPFPYINALQGNWNSRYSDYVVWFVTVTPDGLVYAAEGPYPGHPEVIPRIEVLPVRPFGSFPKYFEPPALRDIVGPNTGIGYPIAIAACPHGQIYIAQIPDADVPTSTIGILEFGATSTGNVPPVRVLLAGDPTIGAIGF